LENFLEIFARQPKNVHNRGLRLKKYEVLPK
jgi:hypothetical protein